MSENAAHKRGMELSKQGEHEASLTSFNQALENEPKNPDIYNDRGVTYFHLKRLPEALADMNKAVELQPDYGYRYSARGYVRDRMGDTEGAVADYQKAVELDPDDAIAQNNLGMLEEKLGYKQAAEKRFKEADRLAEEQGLYNSANGQGSAESGNAAESAIGVKKVDGEESNLPPLPEIKPLNPRTEEEPAQNRTSVMLDVFRRKEAFKDFMRFLRKGLRNDD